MRLTINGDEREVPELETVEDLVQHLQIHRMIVVQRNGEILRRGSFAAEKLQEGDTIEIVHMVGGG